MRGSGRVPSVSVDKRLPAPAATLSSGGETTERCPRCGSHNTKFCYFNNYNLAQPRHFCKACRRYWTVGGTLRNVPIGGSTRRSTQQQAPASSAMRRRPTPPSASASSSSSPAMASLAFDTPFTAPLSAASKGDVATANGSSPMEAVRSFESLLSEPLPAGFVAVGDPFLGGCECFGLGLGLSGGTSEIIDEIGFGIGRTAPAWPFFVDDEVSVLAGVSSTADRRVGGIEPGRDTWQVVAGETEVVGRDGGDCVGWPELAISMTPGKGIE